MEPLDPQLRQLIDEGLPAAMPDDDAQDRGLAALVAHIENVSPPVPPAATATTGLTKLLIGVAAVGTVATGGWVATRSSPEPAPVVAEEPAPAPEAPESPVPSPVVAPPTAPAPIAEPEQAPVATPRKTRRNPAPKATPAAPEPSVADKLRAEAALIARAESALDRNKPREALALCDFHRKDFDAPQLTTERKAIAASAACMIDATDVTAAEAFLRAHPKSALAKKVRLRCDLDPAGKKTTPQ